MSEQIILDTQKWVERVVIGLNLCPFAKSPVAMGRVRWVVYEGVDMEELIAMLLHELRYLTAALPNETETILLIHPNMLLDFEDYNDFLDVADEAVEELDLEGIIQVASFHPGYQFADTDADDVTNYTNRSPYPTLHLLREDSIERAIENYPNVIDIPQTNVETMRKLGIKALRNLMNG